jgi:hypothetical protein
VVHAGVAEGSAQRFSVRGPVDHRERRHHGQIAADLDLGVGDVHPVDIQPTGPHPVQLLSLGHNLACRRDAEELVGKQPVHGGDVLR